MPRQYVHRAAVAEVFLTGWEKRGSDAFTVRAQWPRAHTFFATHGSHQDPLLLAETIRQTGSLLSHAAYGVPIGHQFLMWELTYSVSPAAMAVGPTPTELDLHVTCHDITRRRSELRRMRYTVNVLRDGKPVATGGAAFNCVTPTAYRRLRGGRPFSPVGKLPPPVSPTLVGRSLARDVVLSAAPAGCAGRSPRRWLLHTDTAHPILFDHPVDHVPGMVLLEAARQAAQAVSAQPILPVAVNTRYENYAELDAPCWIEAALGAPDVLDRPTIEVTGRQGDRRIFTSTVTVWSWV
ncbi:ScbA/BarX family gamma-butyrolactone biosynthesis protein [Streptomyces sudanensis]|uniref:ScbA/BarX family gamma-butyrolactone biosynthesis protein n=1 Tax=Streptomyces sudanensis TaxID=436397 RepID=UPI0020CC6A4B|nr:ScbA/BarX family gamma-butyrolactone biosynthesis protein [Streptomyces sudanensis]MCQ0000834.1 gamma-butyrolactone biosynthesis enzyme [Streptomyces sudanensis]